MSIGILVGKIAALFIVMFLGFVLVKTGICRSDDSLSLIRIFGMGTGVSLKRIDTGNLSFPGFQSLIVILENSTVYKTLTSSSLERR